MVGLLWLAHDENCEAELAALIADGSVQEAFPTPAISPDVLSRGVANFQPMCPWR